MSISGWRSSKASTTLPGCDEHAHLRLPALVRVVDVEAALSDEADDGETDQR
jgi:hypothetical protein